MEKDIEKVKMDKINIEFVCDISAVILGHFEIDRFKQEKGNTYFRTLLRVGECESEFATIKAENIRTYSTESQSCLIIPDYAMTAEYILQDHYC